jgi:hypothetical protein
MSLRHSLSICLVGLKNTRKNYRRVIGASTDILFAPPPTNTSQKLYSLCHFDRSQSRRMNSLCSCTRFETCTSRIQVISMTAWDKLLCHNHGDCSVSTFIQTVQSCYSRDRRTDEPTMFTHKNLPQLLLLLVAWDYKHFLRMSTQML